MVSSRLVLVVIVIVVVLAIGVDAAYRKPPFNGSIFGKRSNTATDYEIAIRALSVVCEATSETCETCNAWLTRQETN